MDTELWKKLNELRKNLAKEQSTRPHLILTEEKMQELISANPKSRDSLIDVIGNVEKVDLIESKVLDLFKSHVPKVVTGNSNSGNDYYYFR